MFACSCVNGCIRMYGIGLYVLRDTALRTYGRSVTARRKCNTRCYAPPLFFQEVSFKGGEGGRHSE